MTLGRNVITLSWYKLVPDIANSTTSKMAEGYASLSLLQYFIFCCLVLAIVINIGNYTSMKFHNEYMCQEKISLLQSAESKVLLQDAIDKRHSLTDFLSQKGVSMNIQGERDEAWIDLEVQSDRKLVYVSINGIKIYEINESNDRNRGMHIIILNQQTGALMVSEVFDFYGGDSNNDFSQFLYSIHRSRITIFFIKDEASTTFTKLGRSAVKSFGCRLVDDLEFRDNWVCITRPRVGLMAEGIVKKPRSSEWANPAKVRISTNLEKSLDHGDQCNYADTEKGHRRKVFCQNFEGYWDVCNCSAQLFKEAPKLKTNNLAHAPIVIIASNRPRYLFRMLYKLQNVPGADRKMMTVFIDGFYNETIAVAELFGLKVVINEIECTKICRIQQHYKKSLSRIFDDFPLADVAIILEEDLDVSDDIFDYFSQTYPLFKKDSSIYCISAWNDQGYQHSVKDPLLLYRVETMPGLGW